VVSEIGSAERFADGVVPVGGLVVGEGVVEGYGLLPDCYCFGEFAFGLEDACVENIEG
jgi:hypothetical protein